MEKFNINKKKLAVKLINNLRAKEMDIYLTIVYKLIKQNKLELKLSFEELKDSFNLKSHDNDRFAEYLKNIADIMFVSTYKINQSEKLDCINFITYAQIDRDDKVFELGTTKEALNLIKADFDFLTKATIKEFCSLKTRNAKLLYLLIKQNDKKNIIYFETDEFREVFNVPDSYRMIDIDKRIIEPSINELSDIFKNFSIKKLKARKGNTIGRIRISYKPISAPKKFRIKNTTEINRQVNFQRKKAQKINIEEILNDKDLYKIIQNVIVDYYKNIKKPKQI